MLGGLMQLIVLLSIALTSFSYQGEQCRSAGGTCMSEGSCDGQTLSGYCPTQANNIKCCIPGGRPRRATADEYFSFDDSTLPNGMNLSVDPCEDFNEYVCGGWFKEMSQKDGKKGFSFASEARRKTLELLTPILKNLDVTGKPVTSYKWKVKTLFNKCVEYYSDKENQGKEEEEQIRLIRQIIKEVGGWPLFHINMTEDLHSDPKPTVFARILGKISNKCV